MYFLLTPNEFDVLINAIVKITFLAGEVFQAYDYGTEGNLNKYGSTKPLQYDLTKITAPVCFPTDLNVTTAYSCASKLFCMVLVM